MFNYTKESQILRLKELLTGKEEEAKEDNVKVDKEAALKELVDHHKELLTE